MDVFHLRDRVVQEYADYIRSFVTIRDERIRENVEEGFRPPPPRVPENPPEEGEARAGHGPPPPPPAPGGEHTGGGPAGELRPHYGYRLREEPLLHRPHRGPCAPGGLGQGDPGHHRLPHERPGEQPDAGAGEVPPPRLSPGQAAGDVQAVYGPGGGGGEEGDPGGSSGHFPHQLRDAGADPDPPG